MTLKVKLFGESLLKVDILVISACKRGEVFLVFLVFIRLSVTHRPFLFFFFLSVSPGLCLSFLPPPHSLLSILSISVTNLFLFISPPVFCSVSLFISFPFKLFFCGFDRVTPCRGKKKTNFDFFFLHNYGAKKQNMKKEF